MLHFLGEKITCPESIKKKSKRENKFMQITLFENKQLTTKLYCDQTVNEYTGAIKMKC